jgi:hypothetical protein
MEYNPSKSDSARPSELSSCLLCNKEAPKMIEGEDSFADLPDEVMKPELEEDGVDSREVAKLLESISCHSAVGTTGLSERFSTSGAAYLE